MAELTCRYGAQRNGGQVERLVRPPLVSVLLCRSPRADRPRPGLRGSSHTLPVLKAVAEVTVGRTLHDGLRSRELDDGRADLCNVIVKVADQERA
jgi:hypothetical protein